MSIVEVAAARAAPYAAEHVDALLEDCKEHYAEAYEASYGANRERAREARRARLAHRAGMAALRAFFALGDDAGESAQAVVEAYLKERIVALLDALIHTEIKPPMRAQVVKRVWWVACVPCARCALVRALEGMLVAAVNDVVALEIDEAFAYIVEKKQQKRQRPPTPPSADDDPADGTAAEPAGGEERKELELFDVDKDEQCACFDTYTCTLPHAASVSLRGGPLDDEEPESPITATLLDDPEAVVTTYSCTTAPRSSVTVISNPDGRAALVF